MGCSCCLTSEEIISPSSILETKNQLHKEYKLYLSFLHEIKSSLNSSIIKETKTNNINPEIEEIAKRKEFYLLPKFWFDNWEKRIEFLIRNKKYKPYNLTFEYQNVDNKQKFYYELGTSDFWGEINRNKIYNINGKIKMKLGIIINNLIIIQHFKSNNIEIFFFENEDDIFFKNLLFSFEKVDDIQKEKAELLNRLKTSPIQEILGNMHYDYFNLEFMEPSKKIMIYNKTKAAPENINKFRRIQYDLLFNCVIGDIDSKNKSITNKEDDNKESEIKYKCIRDYREREITKNINTLSRASTSMKFRERRFHIVNGKINDISGIKIFRPKNLVFNNFNEIHNNNSNLLNFKNSFQYGNHCGISEIKNTSKIYMKSYKDVSTMLDGNKFIFENDSDNEENFLEAIIYCIYNIHELTNYLMKIQSDVNQNNIFYFYYLGLIKFLATDNPYGKDIYIQNKKYLLKDCLNYNYDNFMDNLISDDYNNIISKIINTLNIELKENNKNERIINGYDDDEEIKSKDKENSNELLLRENKKENNSFIFDLFYSIIDIKISCNLCKKTATKSESINIIEFDVIQLENYYSKIENKIEENKIDISIEDCLNYYLNGNENNMLSYACFYCKSNENLSISYKINKSSEILILNYNYDNYYKIKDKLNINIQERIEINNEEFELFELITLDKLEMNKFTSYCINNENHKWLIYSENKIDECNYSEIFNLVPIILFYKKIKGQ